MKRPLLLLSICCLLIGLTTAQCGSSPDENPIEIEDIIADSANYFAVVNLDTAINDSCFVLIESINAVNSTLLTVHNGTWDTVFDLVDAQRNYSINSHEQYKLAWSTTNFATVRVGCGNSCFDDLVIPLNSGGIPERYSQTFSTEMKGITLEENLLAYMGATTDSSEFPFVIIKNLITGKMDSLQPSFEFEQRLNAYSDIDTIFATSSYFMIGQWDLAGKIIHKSEKKIDLKAGSTN